MQNIELSQVYAPLIKKLKRRRTLIFSVYITAIILTFLATLNISVYFPPFIQFEQQGNFPLFIVLILIEVLAFVFLRIILVDTPVTNSMNTECDSKKFLILTASLNSKMTLSHNAAVGFFHDGNYLASRYWASEGMNTTKDKYRRLLLLALMGFCEYFLGNFSNLEAATFEFEKALNENKKIKGKKLKTLNAELKVLKLLLAVSKGDTAALLELGKIPPVNKNIPVSVCYSYFLNGLSSFTLQNYDDAFYRMQYVKENMSKTAFLEIANSYIQKIKEINASK